MDVVSFSDLEVAKALLGGLFLVTFYGLLYTIERW